MKAILASRGALIKIMSSSLINPNTWISVRVDPSKVLALSKYSKSSTSRWPLFFNFFAGMLSCWSPLQRLFPPNLHDLHSIIDVHNISSNSIFNEHPYFSCKRTVAISGCSLPLQASGDPPQNWKFTWSDERRHCTPPLLNLIEFFFCNES